MNASEITATLESHRPHPWRAFAAEVRAFVWHFVQMVLAMAAFMVFRRGAHVHGGHEHAGHQPAGSPEAETIPPASHEPPEANTEERACHAA